MSIVWTILIGFVAGLVARAIKPGDDSAGFIVTTLIGIAGSLIATYVGQAMGWYTAGQGAGFIASRKDHRARAVPKARAVAVEDGKQAGLVERDLAGPRHRESLCAYSKQRPGTTLPHSARLHRAECVTNRLIRAWEMTIKKRAGTPIRNLYKKCVAVPAVSDENV